VQSTVECRLLSKYLKKERAFILFEPYCLFRTFHRLDIIFLILYISHSVHWHRLFAIEYSELSRGHSFLYNYHSSSQKKCRYHIKEVVIVSKN